VAWTYSLASLGTSKLYQVRRLIGDVIANDQQIADEEINFALTQQPTIYGAAAEAARYIAAQYSRKVDTTNGVLNQNYSNMARAYAALAVRLDAKDTENSFVTPYAGGISVANKQRQEGDSDRVAPQFTIGGVDNLIPIPSSGSSGNGGA
jgi:hypothetical protein